MSAAPDPEAPSFVKLGNVMYNGVPSVEDIDPQLRAGIADEEKLLDELLAYNHGVLVETGLAQTAIELDRARAVYQEDSRFFPEEDDAEFDGDFDGDIDDEFPDDPVEGELEGEVELDEEIEQESRLDGLADRVIEINDSTQFRVAENIEAEEPCDESATGGALFLVIYNGIKESDQMSFHEVGNRLYMPEGVDDIVVPNTPAIPEELHLNELEVVTVARLVDRIKNEWRAGNLPHLGDSGFYDTLVVEAGEV